MRTDLKNRIYNVFGESFNMVFVEGGTCNLGSKHINAIIGAENTLHTATLKDFFIGEALVTEKLYSLVVGRTFEEDKSQYPASIHICEALYFIFKLNQITGECFRIPTLDEWEYAAKGGKMSKGFKYSGSNDINEVAWYEGNSNNCKHPIKLKKPNELGIYDMSGNLLEYCACNTFSCNHNSWNNSYLRNEYKFDLYRGGCYGAPDEFCEITFIDDWAQDWYECRGFRLCL